MTTTPAERLKELRERLAVEARSHNEMMGECCTEESLNGYQAALDAANEQIAIIDELLRLRSRLNEGMREALEKVCETCGNFGMVCVKTPPSGSHWEHCDKCDARSSVPATAIAWSKEFGELMRSASDMLLRWRNYAMAVDPQLNGPDAEIFTKSGMLISSIRRLCNDAALALPAAAAPAETPFPKYPHETLESMAEIGEAFMDAMPERYVYSQSPAEIIADLQNQIYDLEHAPANEIRSGCAVRAAIQDASPIEQARGEEK